MKFNSIKKKNLFTFVNPCLPLCCRHPRAYCEYLEELQLDDLVQACSNSNVLAMELLQSCTKPWYVHQESSFITASEM